MPALASALPGEDEQQTVVLGAIAVHGWGPRTLVRLLRGDEAAGPNAQRSPHFGALAYRSEAAIRKVVETMKTQGLVAGAMLDDERAMIQITPAGRARLRAKKGK